MQVQNHSISFVVAYPHLCGKLNIAYYFCYYGEKGRAVTVFMQLGLFLKRSYPIYYKSIFTKIRTIQQKHC